MENSPHGHWEADENNPEFYKDRRERAPDAHKLHGERIGHMAITAESLRNDSKRAEAAGNNLIGDMNRDQLLAYSHSIKIEGKSLSEYFNSHLIGERGLRRLISEYIRGGDMDKSLEREIVEHEIDYERDPAMRDLTDGVDASGDSKDSANVLEKMLDKAAKKLPAADGKPRSDSDEDDINDSGSGLTVGRSRVLDIAFVSVIALLIIVIIILYITRR